MTVSSDPAKRAAQAIRYAATVKAGMSEPEYRDWLRVKFGVASARDLSAMQRRAAHAQLDQLIRGDRPARSSAASAHPQIAKLAAIWSALANAGVVRDGSRAALESWCLHRVPGLRVLQWATSEQLQVLIEAAKAWAARTHVTLR